jgi:ribosomal protein S18 acetylase RimI-like enzyme
MEYTQYTPQYEAELLNMVKTMYIEDAGGNEMNNQKITNTILHLQNHPDNGKIILFHSPNAHQIIGYAILIHFWSNDYGGLLTFIDELFIKETHRGQGHGTKFIKHLIQIKYNKSVAFFLEVRPSNQKALDLYQRLGFKNIDNRVLKLEI